MDKHTIGDGRKLRLLALCASGRKFCKRLAARDRLQQTMVHLRDLLLLALASALVARACRVLAAYLDFYGTRCRQEGVDRRIPSEVHRV